MTVPSGSFILRDISSSYRHPFSALQSPESQSQWQLLFPVTPMSRHPNSTIMFNLFLCDVTGPLNADTEESLWQYQLQFDDKANG